MSRVHVGAMLNVPIFERWSVSPTLLPLGSRTLRLSKVLGVWNQERVYWKFPWIVVLLRQLVVHTIEHVYLIALVVESP